MARKSKQMAKAGLRMTHFDGTIDFEPPGQGACIQLDDNGSIHVGLHSPYSRIYAVEYFDGDFPPGDDDVGTVVSMTMPASGSYSADIGATEGARYIRWLDQTNGPGTILAVHECTVSKNCPHGCPHVERDGPISAELTLTLGGRLKPGTAPFCDEFNQPARLIYAGAQYKCSWISAPISCGGELYPAFWTLKRTEDKWIASLKRIAEDLAVYEADAGKKAKKADVFQIVLHLNQDPEPSEEFKDWPKTITITNAE